MSVLDDVGSQETKPTETVPKTQSLLRPSAFSVPVTTAAAGVPLQLIDMLLLIAECINVLAISFILRH